MRKQPTVEEEVALVARWIALRKQLGILNRIYPKPYTGRGTVYYWRGVAYDSGQLASLVKRLELQLAFKQAREGWRNAA